MRSFTPSETATVLAALRYWQGTVTNGPKLNASYIVASEHFADTPPLTDLEIDDLCEAINAQPEQPTADTREPMPCPFCKRGTLRLRTDAYSYRDVFAITETQHAPAEGRSVGWWEYNVESSADADTSEFDDHHITCTDCDFEGDESTAYEAAHPEEDAPEITTR